MVDKEPEYILTDFDSHGELLQDLVELETKIRSRMGEHVHLIAYTRHEEVSGCRAGLSD
ncbi:hypothetical protein [Paenibacillus sp. J2TS4]|uniref:hypothetical protein n=1 Tax=Paenibacillus sp. J2TS4 TaxID=2807194 RepID=UPI001B0D7994|nr:hypothetical protein [Paenibacillus sp. J2TS4]GIP33770.1 hypothetical protein J2TS4_29800 [Paenibacillus sp. J2TS4]